MIACLVPSLMVYALATAPASAAGAAIDYAALNAAVVKNHLLPRYRAFTGRTAALAAATDRLCPDVSPTALAAARDAFHSALDAWHLVEHLRQGPPAAADTHIRVKFWPDRKSIVDKHLTRLLAGKDATILKPEPFAHVSVAVQGFPAMERLLFGTDAPALLQSGDGPVRPCAVVRAIAGNLHGIAAGLEGRWASDPNAGRPAKRVTTDLFNDLATGLGAVADLKLGAPLGSDGKRRPRRAENWLSGRALRNVAYNITALADLYDGLATAEGGHIGRDEDALIRDQFAHLIETLKDYGPSLTAMLKTEKGALRLKVLKSEVQDLRELVIVNLSEALDLVLGFNSLDGD